MVVEPSTQELQQLAAVYQLLSRLWVAEADRQVLETLIQPAMRLAWERMGGFVPDDIDEPLLEDLAVDYCQLLVGPTNQISPIQSVWESDLLQSQAAESMQRYFKLLPEFQPAINIPDHFAVQLQFVSALLEQCHEGENHVEAIKIASEFFADHLSWTSPFLRQVDNRAKSQFYSSLAKLTHNFLHEEK